MAKKNDFKLIMISAMYENGGNTLQRFFDGHPQLYVYPFESQPGTFQVSDFLTSVFPQKYRWPTFSLSGNIEEDYESIIDEEFKRHVKTPFASKFKDAKMSVTDSERKKLFLSFLKKRERTRASLVEAYFVSTFQAWKNHNRSGKEIAYVGYSPIIGVDAEKIISDFPNAHIVHIVRNPYSAFADTKKRPVPYSLSRYTQTWNIVQLMAKDFSVKFPKNFFIVKFEDLVSDPKGFFANFVKKLGIRYYPTLEYPSWNGQKLENLVPWGTISHPTKKNNMATFQELSKKEYEEIKLRTQTICKLLGYDNF